MSLLFFASFKTTSQIQRMPWEEGVPEEERSRYGLLKSRILFLGLCFPIGVVALGSLESILLWVALAASPQVCECCSDAG